MLNENQREIIVQMFDTIDDALPLTDMAQDLRELGYASASRIIRDAIQEGLLYVDAVEDDGTVYLALTDWGEEIWEELNE